MTPNTTLIDIATMAAAGPGPALVAAPAPVDAPAATPVAPALDTDSPCKVLCRGKDLNAKGNGDQTTRRFRLPDGSTGWASELAQDVEGSWSQGSFLASDRKCRETGYVPVGTIIVEYTTSLRGGQKTGRATIRAGRVLGTGPEGDIKIDWTVAHKGSGLSVQVKLADGTWAAV